MRQLVFLLIFTTVILTGCATSEEIKPIMEENIDFDINTATEMIKEKEELIIELAMKETVTKKEYDEYEEAFTEQFGQHAQSFLEMFIILGSENETETGTYLIQETLYPTVFHKGIAITDAVIYKSYYENEFFNETRLMIKQEYTGDDNELEGWKREYVFDESEDGDWEIHAFSGEMNFVGDDFSMQYLEFE
ncbi:hypothetical protein [Evansella cellulosilytica]|uniref:Uncharacterized protein n=1 Tax=Evansella cellulosilytica (strain ATCC 21833 / DSM 2522 / FERM P-1141 / JCM 9156 / N-4) TaxID=649639 RepID=E6TWE8_EVAC2|nr:hypothetical protein [Evansella cellulosilytica]ADU32211.1 hypothetical protein Bcell_3978 [Evansella cellulosilytica DSM 2522]